MRAKGQRGYRCQMLSGKQSAPGTAREGRRVPKLVGAGAVGKAARRARAFRGHHSHCQTCTAGTMLGEPTPPLLSSILPPSAVPPSAEPNRKPRTENGGMQSRGLSLWCWTDGEKVGEAHGGRLAPWASSSGVVQRGRVGSHMAGLLLGPQPQFSHL